MSFPDYIDQLNYDSNSSDLQFEQDELPSKRQNNSNKNKKQMPNTKNAYINKISSLIKITNQEQSDEKQRHMNINRVGKKQLPNKIQSQLIIGSSNCDKEDKLAKNRESARNSRKRKKIYLELLETKVTKLSEQLEIFKRVNDQTTELATSLQSKINQRQDQDQNKIILFSNLQNSVQSNINEMNIDTFIESLNKKFGSGSLDRQQQIDHYSRQIYENCLSPYLNYIIGVAKTDQDIFASSESLSEHGILRSLKLTDKQKQTLQKKQKKLLRYQNELTNTLSSFQDIKNQVQLELGAYGQTLEQLRKELKPSQVAKFLLEIEKKDMQHQFKDQFEKCFGSEFDEDDSLDLYQFMAEHNYCNTLGIDIQNTYQIYKQSNDFLKGRIDVEESQQTATKIE
ncbi:unnamed protein product (macronuclear) [Paramecium tetraurelia]|uniref:BZIP domain-containing protein n=1 Tax=Paramecium tetraurelia TaxID=5888 RepID=A0BCW7_PARTE|nr:uncharacterized protein GSPATT00004478001 [Paramecium tetraurelia]CAK56384.1 unnamed protein product [Paramecium tetraurelia]|eukprot:XP_001423782.1 hypothetical protein (macronuclear) [Paramecium tetraurelia strain d4-2]